jgi:ribosomal protein L17
MRHKKNRLLELSTGMKKKDVVIRELLTNLVASWKIVTTWKRAKVLKAEADHFFSKLLEIVWRYENENDQNRECIRYVKSRIFGEDNGKKVIQTYLPKYKESSAKSFVANYKMWFRLGDWADKIMIKLL